LGVFQRLEAKSVSLPRMMAAAWRAAMPLRSAPEEAAVAEVFGTLPVVVAVIRTAEASIPNSSATTCATLV
jgi:hypothetical protein